MPPGSIPSLSIFTSALPLLTMEMRPWGTPPSHYTSNLPAQEEPLRTMIPILHFCLFVAAVQNVGWQFSFCVTEKGTEGTQVLAAQGPATIGLLVTSA